MEGLALDPTQSRLMRTVCQNHLTNGGTRSSAEVKQFLASHTDHELAVSLFENDPLYVPGKIRSYCTAEGLEPVFATLRAGFPVWMASAS